MSNINEEFNWPHAPVHRLSEHGTYFITAGTYRKEHFFKDPLRLDVMQRGLIKLTQQFGWTLEAWCIFPNHYHFVAHASPEGAKSLSRMLTEYHSRLSRWINRLDNAAGRKVWCNIWDVQLTYEKSYFARLKYTHTNAVHHKIVTVANQYKWCSAHWFEHTATPSQVKTIYEFKIDKIHVEDNF